MTIVDAAGQVCPGVYPEAVEFNYRDYRYHDFFGREIRGRRKKNRFHAFHYLGLISAPWTLGMALIDLSYLKNAFLFLHHHEEGLVLSREIIRPGFSSALTLPRQPDTHSAFCRTKPLQIAVEKTEAALSVSAETKHKGKTLSLSAEIPYARNTHQPLRIISPSSPSCWTFTEKCSPLTPSRLSVSLNGKALTTEKDPAHFVYDWSAGYMRRETNWYWSAFTGTLSDGRPFGGNFASLVNESYTSENGLWLGASRDNPLPHRQFHLPRIRFNMNHGDLYKPWKLEDENSTVRLQFTPRGEYGKKMNAGPLKASFRQFFGSFEGEIDTPEETLRIKEFHGLCEFHRTLW